VACLLDQLLQDPRGGLAGRGLAPEGQSGGQVPRADVRRRGRLQLPRGLQTRRQLVAERRKLPKHKRERENILDEEDR
jgi:hypothetical protein